MASSSSTTSSSPLYDKIVRNNPLHKAFNITILALLASLIIYRFTTLNQHGFAWRLALFCELCFTFVWLLTITTKWTQVEYKTYPERLLSSGVEELPPVDVFVTTADPVLEPPIITINTVISLLAIDYPAHKLACYASDDGCSPITFYCLVEASKFAKLWVPFCKKYNVQVRAPFRYFLTDESMSSANNSTEFQQDYKKMNDEYEMLGHKIKVATEKSVPQDKGIFANTERRNHPTIIQVIWENKEDQSNDLPHFIYISREKRPEHHHHYKAGAMNVLTRVSGLITNAPFMLNVDCDMFVNNPQIIRHALCFLLGSKNEREAGYVQSPQYFYDGLKDDPFGNQMIVLFEYMGRGIAGHQGPLYGGTGCFHRRKVIYGLCPDDIGNQAKNLTPVNVNLEDKEMMKIYGNSMEFIKSAAYAIKGKTNRPKNLSDLVDAASQVAGCCYEHGTSWGTKVGWQYGSTTEDVLTGLMIHTRGWRSVLCTPKPLSFLGCAPGAGPASMTQMKRWSTGLLEILISRKSPFFATINGKLQFGQSLAYMWILLWNVRSIPELCYALLPAYCILTNSSFLPKVHDPAIYMPITLLATYNLYTLLEFLQCGLSIREWWNNQRMARITSISSWLFGVLSVILKILGISDTVFEVTRKDESSSDDGGDAGRFTFDNSPIFVPGTTVLLVELTALIMGLIGLKPLVVDRHGAGFGEMVCCALIVMCLLPFLKGLFRKGKYGIPLPTICKSVALTLVFVHLCRRNSLV